MSSIDPNTPLTMTPRWNSDGLLPAIAQDASSGTVLMLAWMNRESLALTLAEKRAVYWSRSRQEIWRKGETSGNVQELVDINIGDIDIQQQLVTVTGKGCKTRTVPVGRAALSALERWLAVKPGGVATDPEQAVFTSRQGRRISPRSVQSRLARLAATGRLAQPLHPHMLRHAFASHMLESSGDLRAVQELLGHANIGTTQIYTHLDFQHLAKTYDAAHPRAQRRKKP